MLLYCAQFLQNRFEFHLVFAIIEDSFEALLEYDFEQHDAQTEHIRLLWIVFGIDLLLTEAEHELGRQIDPLKLGILKDFLICPVYAPLAHKSPLARKPNPTLADSHLTIPAKLRHSNQYVDELVHCLGMGVLKQGELGD
jgi:hypothetical protein